MNKLFQVYLIGVWLVGFYPVTNPFASITQVKFRIFHAITLLSLLWAFLPLCVAFDDLQEGNEKARLAGHGVAMSIIRYTILFSKYLVNFFLRITAVLHCNELIDIVTFLVSTKQFTRYNIKWDTFKYLVILSLVSIMVMVMDCQALWAFGVAPSQSLSLVDEGNNGTNLPGNGSVGQFVYTYAVLPEDETLRKLIIILVEWYCKTASLVALGYIVVIGLYLIELHQDTCMELAMKFYTLHPENLKIMIENDLSSIGLSYYTTTSMQPWGARVGAYFGSDTALVGPNPDDYDFKDSQSTKSKKLQQDMDIFFITGKGKPMDYDEFSDKFKSLKACFCKYGEAAGIFSLLILVNSSAFIIESVGRLAFEGGLVEERFRNVFVALFFIFMVAHFGDYMSAKMDENRDELRNAMGHFGYKGESKLEKVSGWVIDWQWNLTAKNLFEMNHSVIPANLGTIMTYFIFIFQLKMSEDEKLRKAH